MPTPPKLETTTDVLIAAMEHAERMEKVVVMGFKDGVGFLLTNCNQLERIGMFEAMAQVVGAGDADPEC